DGLRVLVNNAGVESDNLPIEYMPLESWQRLFATNVFGLVEVTKRAVPIMRAAGGGVICNVTSSSTLAPVPFLGTYRASKAAVTALGESLAAEVAQFGIRVIEIMPGPIETSMLAASDRPAAAVAWYRDVLGLAVLSPPYRMEGEAISRDMGELLPSPVVVKAAIVGIDDGTDRVIEVIEYPSVATGAPGPADVSALGFTHVGL